MAEEKNLTPDEAAKEKELDLKDPELAEELIELRRSVEYWKMSQTHSCIYPL